MSTTDVLLYDSTTDSIRTYRFTSPNWAQVGSVSTFIDLSLNLGSGTMCQLTSTDFAFIETTSDLLRYYRLGYVAA